MKLILLRLLLLWAVALRQKCSILTTSDLNSSINFLTSSSLNGNVFVSTTNDLYRLSNNLRELQQVPLNYPVLGITVTIDGKWLVMGSELGNGWLLVTVYNTNNLTNINKTHTIAHPSGSSSIAFFTASLAGMETLYFGTGNVLGQTRRFNLHQLDLVGSCPSKAFESSTSESVTRRFYGGFHLSKSSYFLGLDTDVASTTMYIVRVCNIADGSMRFNARYELQLVCGDAFNTTATITGVSVVGGTLVVSVAGRLCSYNISIVDAILDNYFSKCLIDKKGANTPKFGVSHVACSTISAINSNPTLCDFALEPLHLSVVLNPSEQVDGTILVDSGVLISLASEIDSSFYIFVGTSNHFYKYILTDSDNSHQLYSLKLPGAVSGISRSSGSEYVYATVEDQVLQLPLEDCSKFLNCSSCVQNKDPLCGWCTVELKCSRRAQCQNNNKTRRYIVQGSMHMCIKNLTIEDPEYFVGIHSIPHHIKLKFSPANPPPALPGELLLCVFDNEDEGITFNTTLTDDVACELAFLPQISNIRLVTDLSLYSSQSALKFFIIENGYTFYNCTEAKSCQACIQTGKCGWCLYDFTCTGHALNCSIINSFTRRTNGDYFEVCPLVTPPYSAANGLYVHPVAIATPFTVTGRNLLSENEAIEYICRFGVQEIQGKQINSSKVECMVSLNQLIIINNNSVKKTPFELLLRRFSGDKEYTVETSTGRPFNVTLYQCSALANGCSSCLAQRIGTNFQCGWCTDPLSCVDAAEPACSSFNTLSGNCPQPSITEIFPNSGPTDGGTTITITGTNLGIMFDDIISILVGSVQCTPLESNYIAGRKASCDIGWNSNQQAGVTDIVMMINTTGGVKTVTSTQQFQFVVPRVWSISPSIGPVAGGTMVSITGEELNIGNKERTSVSLVLSNMSNNRSEVNVLADCVIQEESIKPYELRCFWASSPVNTSGVIEVYINNAVLTNASVTYEYHNNPIYEMITPKNSIRSGGIKLQLTGKNLDVAQQPRMLFAGGNKTIQVPCNATATTLVCLTPPLNTLDNYTVVMDSAPGPNRADENLHLTLKADPIITRIRGSTMIPVGADQSSIIAIIGSGIDNVQENEITVYVGSDKCLNQTITGSVIKCFVPARLKPTVEPVVVKIGTNITIKLHDHLEYIKHDLAIAGGIGASTVLGVLLLLIVTVTLLIVIVLIMRHRQLVKMKTDRSIHLATNPLYKISDNAIVLSDNLGYRDSIAYENTHIYEEFPENDEANLYDHLSSTVQNSEGTAVSNEISEGEHKEYLHVLPPCEEGTTRDNLVKNALLTLKQKDQKMCKDYTEDTEVKTISKKEKEAIVLTNSTVPTFADPTVSADPVVSTNSTEPTIFTDTNASTVPTVSDPTKNEQ